MRGDNSGNEIELEKAARELADNYPWDIDLGGYDDIASYVNAESGKGPIADEIIERAIAFHHPEQQHHFLKTLFVIRGQEMLPRIEHLLASDQPNLRYVAIVGLLRIDEDRALSELKQFCHEISDGKCYCSGNRENSAAFDLSQVMEELLDYDAMRYQRIN